MPFTKSLLTDDSAADEGQTRDGELGRFLDWAEREAASLGAHDCGVCLQLARIALESRRGGV